MTTHRTTTTLATLALAGFLVVTNTAIAGNKPSLSAMAPLVTLEAGIPWKVLTAGEQKALEKHRQAWSGYSARKQKNLRDGAQHYLELSPNERNEVERKQKQYREMTPRERKHLREQYRKQKKYR